MHGVVQTDSLLKSACWHTEKRFRRHGNFPSVLWLTEDATGHRQLFETGCVATEQAATDAQLLAALAEEMRADFAQAGVVRFCVAYLGNRVTVIRPLDPNSSMQPKTTRMQGVVIELHDVSAPVRIFRHSLRPPRGKPVLAAPVSLDAGDGPYDDVLAATARGS
jgi:hypothetical protein